MTNEFPAPDVEAIVENHRESGNPFRQKYRVPHLIKSGYLVTGQHHYLDKDWLYPNDPTRTNIAFLSPEHYPKCLWVGKRIQFQEGSRIVGYATITKIYNKILEADEIGKEC